MKATNAYSSDINIQKQCPILGMAGPSENFNVIFIGETASTIDVLTLKN